MDFSRLRTGEIVAAIGGIALFVFMFFDWFAGGVELSSGTENVPGIGEVPTGTTIEETGLSAWDSLQDFSGFLIALSAVSGVALAGLAAAGQRLNTPFPRGAGTATLGSLAVLLILWRFFANPGDLKIGIFLGLVAAVAIAVGAVMALIEGGFQPLVAVAGGRTRAAAASAPAATPTPRPSVPSGSGSAGGRASASRSGTATRSRSSGGSATRSRSKTKSRPTTKRSSSSRSAAGKAPTKRSSSTKSRSASSRSKSSRSSASSRSTTKGGGSSPRSKSSRSKSSGSKSSRSKSSGSKSRSTGTRRRSSGGRKK